MSRLQSHQHYQPQELLSDKFLNKGTGFSAAERDELRLRGLVPPKQEPLELQAQREIRLVRDEPSRLHRYLYLWSLFNRNRTLFFRVLIDNLVELLPVVYTPTVGEACEKFGQIFTGFSGMYFSIQDRGHFRKMLDNWLETPDIIVVTDGGRILGLGDQGAGGMGIPIGKLQLYVAGGGFHPRKTMPVQLDVGTDRETLLKDPFYLGLRYRRLKGQQHEDFVEEFMTAIYDKWPQCVIQFEDFQSDMAFHYLSKYRTRYRFFNDDIQGTSAAVIAGFINGMKLQGTPLCEGRVVFFGAGSSACGCAEGVCQLLMQEGLDRASALERIFLFDIDGLLTLTRGGRELSEWEARFARPSAPGGHEIVDIQELIREVKPHALFGLSGAGPIWTAGVITSMVESTDRPLIFPLSNPNAKAEVSFEDAIKWSNGKGLFAAGSPFDPVEHDGKVYQSSQCNNMFVFPGIGMAAKLSQCTSITDSMFTAAAQAVAAAVSDERLAEGCLYPDLLNLREVGKSIVVACWQQATLDGVAIIPAPLNVAEVVQNIYYEPLYSDLSC